MTNDLATKYKIPPEVMDFVNDGVLEVVSEDEGRKTVELDIPALWTSASSDSFTSYTLIWIHPDHNAEFCHYYMESPGDLPNFYVRIHAPDSPEEQVEDLNTVDDLTDWLHQIQAK